MTNFLVGPFFTAGSLHTPEWMIGGATRSGAQNLVRGLSSLEIVATFL